MHFTNAAKNPHFNVIFVEFYEEQKKKKKKKKNLLALLSHI